MMKRIIRHIESALLLTAVLLSAVSCYDLEGDREICDYNIQLRYDYNEENGTTQNMIDYYVYTIDEYIFDEAGILFLHNRFTPDICREKMNSELRLPPGRYSVIAIGNRDDRSPTTDISTGNAPVKGLTHRDDMRLTLDNPEPMPNGTNGDSERLYHGYRTFTVKERGISRVRVDVINAHLILRFRITWKSGAPPRGSYYALLESVPSEYALMPEHIYPRGSFNCEMHDHNTHDEYLSASNDIIHHIPHTCHLENRPLIHRYNTYLNADKEMWGEFTTYRLKNATAPVLKVLSAADDTNILPGDINLKEYLDWYFDAPSSPYNRDHTLKQEYLINIEIDGNTIHMAPLDVADWDEGTQLTGK